jgi:pyruvate dehydrogenase E1 component alpha subunit
VKKVFETRVECLQILAPDGNVDSELEPDLSNEDMDRMYRMMVLTRTFDGKALKLQREGRLLTYAPSLGQEAAQVASAYALSTEDWMVPSYREHGAYITRGVPLELLYEYWMGFEDGGRIPQEHNDFVVAVPVGSQTLHAVGIAWAAKIKNHRIAVLVYFGDGATSEGDVHEALNFAGVFKIPTVFFCENNQYAISTPRRRQCAAETLAQKAQAYGFEGIQVDGNDVLAVYHATTMALKKAKSDGGPTFIEAITYRMGAHTTSDDPKRYRSEEEVARWQALDPLERFRKYLEHKGTWSEEYEEEVQSWAKKEVERAVEIAEAHPVKPESMFQYVYERMTPNLVEQLEEFRQLQREVEHGKA